MRHNNDSYAARVEDLSVSYGRKTAVQGVSFSVGSGCLVGIIGPNGAGKTTLIKAMMGLMGSCNGSVRLLCRPPSRLDGKCIAYVPQQNDMNLHFPVSVRDVVMMGRYPHMRRLRPPADEDLQAVDESLGRVGMLHKEDRQIGKLSGGERQRVFLARALAQEAELFFLDEPFSDIDFTSEKVIIDLLRELTGRGKTIFAIHHNVDKAFEYFDMLLLINREMVAFGETHQVLTADNLAKTYRESSTQLSDGDELVVLPR